MAERKHYRTIVMDSGRWDGFRFRDGDIVISTPPKCGTTWTQMLVAMLVFDATEFDRPLSQISPWLDMLTNDLGTVTAALEAQEHRRFIKTHTPLDGLPHDDRVTYIGVGRDPRDVALSWDNHMANLDIGNLIAARAAAVGLDDLADLEAPTEPPADPLERFWMWAEADAGPVTGVTLSSILDHLGQFWARRDEPGIALFHYADLLADLPGQLRRLADVLGIAVTAERAEELAAAATFGAMKERADELVPDVDNRIWQSNQGFFNRGDTGQWRHLLDDDGIRRYEARVASLAPPDLAAWAHHGWLGRGSD